MNFVDKMRTLSITQFASILILFLMPFLNVSCSGMPAAKLTGMNLVTGTKIEMQQAFSGQSKMHRIKMEPFAVLAISLAGIGLLLNLLTKKKSIQRLNAGIAFIGAVSLIALHFKLISDAKSKGEGIIDLEFTPFFWITLLLFISALVTSLMRKSPQERLPQSASSEA